MDETFNANAITLKLRKSQQSRERDCHAQRIEWGKLAELQPVFIDNGLQGDSAEAESRYCI